MSSFRIGNKHYKIIPFLITTGTLLFFVFWIGGISYKYHLETEERRKLQEVDIKAKARELNNDIYNENKKLKKENEYMKDTPYEFQRDNGEKEYYNLFTNKLVKKIDKDDTIWEYDKNNGLLLKKTDRYNNVEEYGSHGKMIKKTLSDGVWMEYNPVNQKLMKRKNIDNSIEEFDDNEEKFKEIDKNGKVKFFKTKLYQNISDFKKLNLTIEQLKDIGFTFQQIKEAGYTEEEIVYQNDGKTIKHIKILDSKTKKEIKRIVYRLNGISIYYINEYTSEGIIIKITYYYDNGKEISSIDEFNPEGKPIKTTYYQYDGKTISSIDEYNPEGIKIIKKTYYNRDGTIKEVKYLKDNIERKNEVVKLTTEKKIVYHPDGKTIYYIQEFNPEGKIIKVIYYQDDGKTINFINEYNPEGSLIKATSYNPNGTIKETKTF